MPNPQVARLFLFLAVILQAIAVIGFIWFRTYPVDAVQAGAILAFFCSLLFGSG